MKKISLLTLPEQKNRSNSVKIKNLRVSTTHRISLSNYNSNIIKEKIRKIHQTMASYHMKNLIRTNELVSNTQKSLSKKNLILSLREDLEYHKKINENYKSYEKYADDLCKCYKKNFDDIFIYKKDLTEDLKDFIKMLKDFEVDEKDLINQKRMIKQSNEDIIKYKLEEQINLNKKIIKLNQDLEKQSITLKDLNAILKSNLSMNQNNLINLQNEELKYKDKLEMLENAYKKLIYRYNYYQDLITLETKRKFINENSNIDETNEASIKLKEETIKNNYLKKEINAMKNKMKEIDEMNTSRQRKFKYKINKDNKDITTEVKTTMSKFSDTKLNFTSNFLNP
jgi:hypothetical protein